MASDFALTDVTNLPSFDAMLPDYARTICVFESRKFNLLAQKHPDVFAGWFMQIMTERTRKLRENPEHELKLRAHMQKAIRMHVGILPGRDIKGPYIHDDARLGIILDDIAPSWKGEGAAATPMGENVTFLRERQHAVFHLDADEIGKPEDAIRMIVLPVVLTQIYKAFPQLDPDNPKHYR